MCVLVHSTGHGLKVKIEGQSQFGESVLSFYHIGPGD